MEKDDGLSEPFMNCGMDAESFYTQKPLYFIQKKAQSNFLVEEIILNVVRYHPSVSVASLMIKMKEVGFNEDLVQKSVMEMIQRRKLEYYDIQSRQMIHHIKIEKCC
jgi:hypothetical protein